MATEDDCLEALQRAAEQLSESPTKAQYEELGLTPASATIIRTCGGWNDAKEKAGLETAPSTGSRVKPKPDDIDLPPDLVWEELSVDQRWHYRNVDWNTERSLRRHSRLRSWLDEQKRERGCSRCDIDTAACLDFHHIDGSTKKMAVGRMVTFGHGKDALRAEMAKCDVLCANCHRIVHYTPQNRIDGNGFTMKNVTQDAIGVTSRTLPVWISTISVMRRILLSQDSSQTRDRKTVSVPRLNVVASSVRTVTERNTRADRPTTFPCGTVTP